LDDLFSREELGSSAPREGITKRKLPHAGLILPWPWESKEMEDLGSLGLGVRREGEGARARVGSGEGELLREREREKSGLNDVGPKPTK